VDQSGNVTPIDTIHCHAGETFRLEGTWRGHIYVMDGGHDRAVEVFGEELVVRPRPYRVRETVADGTYCITTNAASCEPDDHVQTSGNVGHIKVGSPTVTAVGAAVALGVCAAVALAVALRGTSRRDASLRPTASKPCRSRSAARAPA
jgi:hypothetical protein